MIDPELQDLLPLYVSEGKRRLERLLELAPAVGSAPSAAEARRELHTLKGSSRMLKLRQIAELCHRGETLLQAPDEETPSTFTALLDQLDESLAELARGESADRTDTEEAVVSRRGQEPGAVKRRREERPREDAPAEGSEPEGELSAEHRISAEAIDQLTGSMAAIRLLALAGANNSRRLAELAQLAERGVTEELPRQVLAMLATQLRQVSADLESGQHRLLRHAEDQLGRLLDLQLQPLRPFLQSLARHARELARELGKEVKVEIEGGEARLDQRIVIELRGAFLHLVTNAVDHGFETPEERSRLGKPATGRLKIAATSYGDRVEIVVADDGSGVDSARVLEAAREAGLLGSDVVDLGPAEVLQLLFTTGFSTRRQVSEVSGRGVGLDAVATAVRQLGGDVWMSSEPGKGSQIFVEVPAARRGETVMVVRSGFEKLALPKSSVRWIRTAGDDDVVQGNGGPLARLDGETLRVVSLAELIGAHEDDCHVLVAVQVARACRILAVEAVEGEEEVLIRPFGRGVPAPEFYSGIALLTTGEPVAVLSPRALVSHLHLARTERPAPAPIERLRVLLVEDSLVTREMERRMLQEEGFRVTATAGAEEALGLLGQEDYDCMVTDLEMPGMNGFELTRHVRSTGRLAQLPIIVVSTRDEPADRMAGLEAGADAYISKQTLESKKLASLIRRLGAGG